MNDNSSYFSKIDSLFDRLVGSSEGIMALFVNTNNASQKFMVCCRKDDTIKVLCKRIANIYYKIYCEKSGGEEEGDDYNHDKLYENIENKQIKVPYITQDYYLLPGFHRVGDLLRDYSQVTANIVEIQNSKENTGPTTTGAKKLRKPAAEQEKIIVQEDAEEEDSEDEEIKENLSKKLKTETGEGNIVQVGENTQKSEGNSKNKKKKHNKAQEESQRPEEISQIIEEKPQKEESKKKKKKNKKEAIEEKGEDLVMEAEEVVVNKKFSEDMSKERKISKEVEFSSDNEESENANKKLMKGMEVIAKKDKAFNILSSGDESSDDDKKLKKEGKATKKGTNNQSRSK